MALLTPVELERANTLLDRVLAPPRAMTLGDAARWLSQADLVAVDTGPDAPRLGEKVTRRLVSTLLRKRGYVAAGTAGTGYDRDTLYRRAPAMTPVITASDLPY